VRVHADEGVPSYGLGRGGGFEEEGEFAVVGGGELEVDGAGGEELGGDGGADGYEIGRILQLLAGGDDFGDFIERWLDSDLDGIVLDFGDGDGIGLWCRFTLAAMARLVVLGNRSGRADKDEPAHPVRDV